jgi:hypothetical protein
MSTTVREFIKRKLSPRKSLESVMGIDLNGAQLLIQAHKNGVSFERVATPWTPGPSWQSGGTDLGFARSGIRNTAGLR